MPFVFKVAFRYLTANKAQTGLLVSGVAVGVFVFVFMSALIGGLAVFLVQRTVGDVSHVTIEAPDRSAQAVALDSASLQLLANSGRIPASHRTDARGGCRFAASGRKRLHGSG